MNSLYTAGREYFSIFIRYKKCYTPAMKLEKRFYTEHNSLFFLDGTECPVQSEPLHTENGALPDTLYLLSMGAACVELDWKQVGVDEESYNEAFLAALRESLKALETLQLYVFISPSAGQESLDSQEAKDAFIASMSHCARRIKDCASVVGFAVPPQLDAAQFMAELSRKHSHYVFFSRDESLLASDEAIVRW